MRTTILPVLAIASHLLSLSASILEPLDERLLISFEPAQLPFPVYGPILDFLEVDNHTLTASLSLRQPQHPHPAASTITAPAELRARKATSACAQSYYACSNAGGHGYCCPLTAFCSNDQAGLIGCCPHGAACTGTVAMPSTSAAFGATQTTSSTVTITTPSTVISNSQTPAQGGFVSGETIFAAEGTNLKIESGIALSLLASAGFAAWLLYL